MAVNELIQRQEKELVELDKHVLPDTLNADEWQTFIFSGFLNEYNKEQAQFNIDQLNAKIKTLEELDYTNKEIKPTLIGEMIKDFMVNFAQSLGMMSGLYIGFIIVGVLGSIFFKDSIGKIADDIYMFLLNFVTWPYTKIFNKTINPDGFISQFLIYIVLPYISLCVLIGLIFAFSGLLHFRRTRKNFEIKDEELRNKEKARLEELEKTKKELDDYLPIAKEVTEECNRNLEEIYGQNLIPEMYHDVQSLGMLYGYFVCKAAMTFQDAAKEYLQDQRTNQLIQRMDNVNDLLGQIARKKEYMYNTLNEINDNLQILIKQNDRSVLEKLIANNPISKIYSKAKSSISKNILNK